MKFNPPPEGEIADRVTQRSDDTEEKVRLRLEQFQTNVNAVVTSIASLPQPRQSDHHRYRLMPPPPPQVRVRLEQFHANVNAVVDFYKDVKTEIDGTDKPDKVYGQIKTTLDAAVSK